MKLYYFASLFIAINNQYYYFISLAAANIQYYCILLVFNNIIDSKEGQILIITRVIMINCFAKFLLYFIHDFNFLAFLLRRDSI